MKRREIITWVDAASVDNWVLKDEIQKEPLEVETIGRVMFENRRVVALAGSYAKRNGRHCCIMIIPKLCIIKRKKIK